MATRKGLGQANTFRTNNNTSTGYGIVYADEVSGHRTVANLTALYALNDWQLSASGDNTNSDAIGQLWYVVDADGKGNGAPYQLKDWSKRKEAAGWSIANMEQNAEGLGIHKVYASYAAMVADASAPVGSNGKALRFGQLVVIYDSNNTTQAESGNIYAWQEGNTGAAAWLLIGNLGSISKNAVFAGIATPTTNPGTPDGPIFYIATEAGTYSNFDGISVADGEAVILEWDNGAWTKKVTGFATSEKLTELEQKIYGEDVIIADLSIAFASKVGGITSTGARGDSSNFTNYYIRNNNYSKVSAFVGAEKNTTNLSIAFYNTDRILIDDSTYQTAYIGGMSFNGVQEQTTYEADVPNGCVIIVVSCRTQLFPNPTASLFELKIGLEGQVQNKVDKVNGKGLSTNDFTDKDKSFLYSIENYDDVSVANGAGAGGAWAYSHKTFKEGQKIRVIMYTPTGITLPSGVATSSTCIHIDYQTTNDTYIPDLLYRQGYDYPIRKGIISEGVITIEGGDTEYIRMYAKCATTEKFGFAIQAIEDNAVNKCYAPSLMIPKFNALSFDSVYTHGRVGVYTFNFLHFSDIHKNEVELKRIKDFSELYQSYLCNVINTGDSVQGLGTEDFSWYAENGSKFLNVIGNHDSATSQSSGGWTGLGKQATYDKYIAPFIADWGVVGTSGNNYYYKDYVSSRNYGGIQTWVKLRLIVLDCMFYDEAQNTWLESTLADARTNGFDVMIAIHTSPASAEPIPCTYTSINPSIQSAGWASYSTENAVQVVKDFIDNGGKFVCWLGGHVHRDTMCKINADNRQLVTLIETCSNNVQDSFDRPYIEGEFEYADAFNIIGIDTYRHLLKIFKVGYEYDGAMRRKGTFVYDYANSKVIFNG